MNKILKQLNKNKLFSGLNLDKLIDMNLSVSTFDRDYIIIQERSICDFLAFILEGEVFIQKHFISGNILTINKLGQNNIFGGAILFADDNTFNYSVQAATTCKILFINKQLISEMLYSDKDFNKNYIKFLSNRLSVFRDKINILQLKDVRSKLVIYISSEMQKNNSYLFSLSHTREEIANIIGVTRPSVSRELKNMVEDNLIEINKRDIKIIDINLFQILPI